MGIEFDIGDRVFAFPTGEITYYIGTVVEVFETFGNRGRRFRVWLDAQGRNRMDTILTPEQRRLSYVFGDWQLQHVMRGSGL